MKSVIKALEPYDNLEHFEKVYALRQYGVLLSQSDKTKYQGQDYI